jgi:two-component system sensor histidine kinase CreC
MKLGIRLLFVFFLLNGLAAFFVLRVFVVEIRPSVREVMEDMMVDTANILAELASDDLAAGRLTEGRFAAHVRNYASRPVDARIWGLDKQSLDFRVYVTDARGLVLFDSENTAQGQDYSGWRDVARTLRGEYGARATRTVQTDERTSVMYVAAPVLRDGAILGVLTVAKPQSTVQRFVDRAERKVLLGGLLLLALSAGVGVAVTLWVVWSIRKLRRYALNVQAGQKMDVPLVPGELGELAQAMEAMRARLEGRDYIEGYVRALTHELKSPVAAIRGAAELLQDDLPEADRAVFAGQIEQQVQRIQRLIDRLLELSKLEQRQSLLVDAPTSLRDCAEAAIAEAQARARQKNVAITLQGDGGSGSFEAPLVALAIGNLLDNAIDFSPLGGTVGVKLAGGRISVTDAGPGVPDYALPRLGERFFSTPRPNGERTGSGLGLAIARQIMALHHGTLHLANLDPAAGPGLRAELVFPS